MYQKTYTIYSRNKYMNFKNLSKSDNLKTGLFQRFEHFNSFSTGAIKIPLKKTNWQLFFYNIFNDLFLILRKYKFFTILLLSIHSKLRKNTYYLIPKI